MTKVFVMKYYSKEYMGVILINSTRRFRLHPCVRRGLNSAVRRIPLLVEIPLTDGGHPVDRCLAGLSLDGRMAWASCRGRYSGRLLAQR